MFEIGSSLREARIRQELGFEELETRTKVRAKYLRHLEDERFDQLPGHAYTKGFLRVYADALGLDGRLYVEEYNSRFVAGEEGGSGAPRMPRAPVGRQRRRRDRRETGTVGIALAAILLVTALVIAAWRFGGHEDPQVEGINASTPRVTAARASKATQQQATLSIRAVKGPSFMEVRAGSASGKPLYTGTLERGQLQRFTKKALYLSVARPGNVVVKFNGAVVTLPRNGRLIVSGATAVSG
jgi:cytoskeleton protein RodZ